MRILIIEDDIALCESIKFQLEKKGFLVDQCHDGEDGLHLIKEQAHDLILLDRMIPLIDGIHVLKTLRAKLITTPVILITALGELGDKITGLDCGADDYMVKPFAFEELMARIRCIARRPQKLEDFNEITYSDITYHIAQKKLCKDHLTCSLSKKESALLEIFLRNPGQILPRSTLLARVWGLDTDVEDGNLDNYIHFLRRRLSSVESILSLKTARGIGYYLEDLNV